MMPPTCAGTAGPLIGGRNARREVARSMKIPKAWRRLSGIAASLSLALALSAAMFGAAPALSQNADCERLRQAISEATNSSGASQYQAAAERQAAELERMAQGMTVDWIDGASRALVQVEQGMRRNLLRSLSLDAMAVSLDRN